MIFFAWWSFAIAAAFLGLWAWRRRRAAATMAVAFGLYGAYEMLMHARVLCSGECNIRVDLLLVWPALVIGSLVALWRIFRPPRPEAAAPR